MVSEEKLQIFRTMDIDDYFCKEVEKVANSVGMKTTAAISRKPLLKNSPKRAKILTNTSDSSYPKSQLIVSKSLT